jgi:hypothetical protein
MGVGTGLNGRSDDRLDVEVAGHPVGLVGRQNVRGGAVQVGVDRDGADAHPAGRTHHA